MVYVLEVTLPGSATFSWCFLERSCETLEGLFLKSFFVFVLFMFCGVLTCSLFADEKRITASKEPLDNRRIFLHVHTVLEMVWGIRWETFLGWKLLRLFPRLLSSVSVVIKCWGERCLQLYISVGFFLITGGMERWLMEFVLCFIHNHVILFSPFDLVSLCYVFVFVCRLRRVRRGSLRTTVYRSFWSCGVHLLFRLPLWQGTT